MLNRLIYSSHLTRPLTVVQMKEIADQASTRNKDIFVTGILLYNKSQFIQVLEGDRSHVNAVFQKILSDDRHNNIFILEFTDASERYFADWNMAYMGEGILTRDLILKYSTTDTLKPAELSAETCLLLLREIAERSRVYDP